MTSNGVTRGPRAVWAWLALVSLCAATAAQADDEFAALLRAGEFGPARALAEATPESRDRMLFDIARAQARAGAGRGPPRRRW